MSTRYPIPWLDHLRSCALAREEIDYWLDPKTPKMQQFDPMMGYITGNAMLRDGIGDSLTISTTAPEGWRTAAIYTDRPCRITTYGNSFTSCHQVSDHETWQEYLAAHLGEPVRNFGVSGSGVYHHCRRLQREEQTEYGAPYNILYIWGDDHYRSAVRCRWVHNHRILLQWKERLGYILNGSPWCNMEMDLETGQLVERESACPTPESVYQMTDPEFFVELCRDDLMMQMLMYIQGVISDPDFARLRRLAEVLGHAVAASDSLDDWTPPAMEGLQMAYGFAVTKKCIDFAQAFCNAHGKQLMVALFCPSVTAQLIDRGTRYDQPVVDYLQEQGTRTFDMNLVHVEDFKAFNVGWGEYYGRYAHGHYNPAGNHFFAHAIKKPIIEWLDPKPVTYRTEDQNPIDFENGYHVFPSWKD
jgi:hypothetical protein